MKRPAPPTDASSSRHRQRTQHTSFRRPAPILGAPSTIKKHFIDEFCCFSPEALTTVGVGRTGRVTDGGFGDRFASEWRESRAGVDATPPRVNGVIGHIFVLRPRARASKVQDLVARSPRRSFHLRIQRTSVYTNVLPFIQFNIIVVDERDVEL